VKRAAVQLALALGISAAACRGAESGAKDAAPAADAAAADAVIEDEEARAKYVEEHLEVTGLDIAPDTKPGDDGGVLRVGGLLRVTGLVTNKGDRAVKNARIGVHVMDASGNVIGSYFHDVAGNKRLAPKEARPFKFQIPEKKEYGGKFTFSLR